MTVKRNLKKKKDSFMYLIYKIQVNIHKILIEKNKTFLFVSETLG